MTAKKLCYVIMPFSKTRSCSDEEWTEIFEEVIKPAVEGAGLRYECRRSEATTGSVIKGILEALDKASVVVADLTDRNPNVFYELGVRHSLRNRTILLAQNRQHIPSDLAGYASHIYEWRTRPQRKVLSSKIAALLESIDADLDRPDNPVADFLSEHSRSIFRYEQDASKRALRSLLTELSMLYGVAAVIEKKTKRGGSTPGAGIPSPALDHLIATSYVNNRELMAQASVVRLHTIFLNSGVSVSRESVGEGKEALAAFRANVKTVLAAIHAGEPVESIDLKPIDLEK
jgi:hypothetical protein